ncbi:hypothetical protein OH77DRAFT_1426977 [Trametes cingulata]|nr:hypothetical protein OH77DRAFT_1426977 [Trametes cingulata]
MVLRAWMQGHDGSSWTSYLSGVSRYVLKSLNAGHTENRLCDRGNLIRSFDAQVQELPTPPAG